MPGGWGEVDVVMGAVPHRGIMTPETAGGTGLPGSTVSWRLSSCHRSLWLPNERSVVPVLAVAAEMGQAAARGLCCNP